MTLMLRLSQNEINAERHSLQPTSFIIELGLLIFSIEQLAAAGRQEARISPPVRALGSTGPDPVKGLTDVLPIADQGIAGFDVRSWQGVFAPAGTPDAVVKKLADGIDAVLKMPEVRARMISLGITPSDLGPASAHCGWSLNLGFDFEHKEGAWAF